MIFILTSSSTTLTYSNPVTVTRSISKNIETYIFTSGNEALLDRGKTGDILTITGILYTGDPSDLLKWTNYVMDASETVTLSGMGDTTLNRDYMIMDINFIQPSGTINRYNYTLSLMRRYDDLG